jgi:hypothetical protein
MVRKIIGRADCEAGRGIPFRCFCGTSKTKGFSMSQVNDGGPAFPQNLPDDFVWRLPGDPGGMSLRDYFAGKARIVEEEYGNAYMEAIVGRKQPERPDWRAVAEFHAEFIARMRYLQADAMLKAREVG